MRQTVLPPTHQRGVPSPTTGAEAHGPGFSSQFYNARKSPPEGEAQLHYAEGGALAKLLFPPGTEPERKTGNRRGRAKGSRIRSFSREARLRMRELTASIARGSKALHLVLTYPQGHPVDPETAKRKHLENFKKRFEEKYGQYGIIWRMEFQGNQVLHFHLLLFYDPSLTVSRAALEEIRTFVARAWWEVCGKLSEEHLRAGTSVERPRSLLRLMKYMSKAEKLQDGEGSPQEHLYAGRRWGVWREELLPITWTVVKVALKHGFQMRRSLRKLLGLKPHGAVCTFRVFVRNDPVKRLLTFLDYFP